MSCHALSGTGFSSHSSHRRKHLKGEAPKPTKFTQLESQDWSFRSLTSRLAMGHTTPDGTAHYETGPWGTWDLTAANGNDFNPFHLELAACPFFPGTSGHKIKSHILKVPNSVIILAGQSTCNWPIKLLRKKIWQLYPSKYGNPHSNCTGVEGSGLHPHFRNEEMEEEVRRLVHIGGTGSQEPKCACFQTRAFCYAEPGRREPSLGGITSPWGHSPIPEGVEGVVCTLVHGKQCRGEVPTAIKISKRLFRLDHSWQLPSIPWCNSE